MIKTPNSALKNTKVSKNKLQSPIKSGKPPKPQGHSRQSRMAQLAMSSSDSKGQGRIKNMLHQGVLKAPIDTLESEEITILLELIKKSKVIKHIEISGETDKVKIFGRRGTGRSKTPSGGSRNAAEILLNSRNPGIILQVIKAIKFRLLLKNSLLHLHFLNMKMPLDALQALASGIVKNKCLLTLGFQDSELNIEGLQQLGDRISKHQCLERLELVNCGLGDGIAGMIRKIINMHSIRRNEIVWMLGLRGDIPTESHGLTQIILSGNHFTDKFLFVVLQALNYDNYIKILDLSNNSISGEGVRDMLLYAKTCNNIISLDLRGNVGYKPNYHKRMVIQLLANIKILQKKYPEDFALVMERKWINKELLTLDIPMDILRSMRDPKDPRDPGERSSHAIQMHSQPSYPDYYRGSESMPNPQHPHLQRQLPPNKQGGHGRTYTESSQEYSKYYSTGSHPNQSFVNTRMMRELLLEQGLGNKSCDARLTGGDQDLFDELDNVVTSLSVIEDGKLTEMPQPFIHNGCMCGGCMYFQRELLGSESQCISLTAENTALRKQMGILLTHLNQGNQGEATYYPGITPTEDKSSRIVNNGEETEIRERIDYLMSELTGLMDVMENQETNKSNTTLTPTVNKRRTQH